MRVLLAHRSPCGTCVTVSSPPPGGGSSVQTFPWRAAASRAARASAARNSRRTRLYHPPVECAYTAPLPQSHRHTSRSEGNMCSWHTRVTSGGAYCRWDRRSDKFHHPPVECAYTAHHHSNRPVSIFIRKLTIWRSTRHACLFRTPRRTGQWPQLARPA